MDFIKRMYVDQDEYQKNVMFINCALGKGIQFIRNDIKHFAKSRVFSKNKFKSIILYNGDRLTVDAQSALRRSIELFSESTRFFMVVQNKQQLLRPILSRFCDMYIYYPIIDGYSINLHTYKRNQYKNDNQNKSYKTFIKNRLNQFNRILLKYTNTDVENIFKLTNELYDKGYSCYDIAYYYKSTDDLKILYHSIKQYYKNEKLLMVYLLECLFRNKEDLEIFELIT
jgi:DNA polymerase III delta prime subunit